MFSLHQTPGRTAFVNNQEHLFFSGYAYLGMNHEPGFKELLQKGIEIYGAVFPSSRISNTALDLYSETENILSRLTNSADTVLFQSGFTAGKAAIESVEKGAEIFQSTFCHPAIRINRNTSSTFADWATQTVQIINNNQFNSPPLILSDSLNQLTAEVYDFSFLNQIEKKIICIIDDSHGIGLLGANGAGISSRLPRKDNIEYIISYSLSKALNIQAGAVSCTDKNRAEKLRKTTWYTAVTPPSPAFLYAFCKASNTYQQQREKLETRKLVLQNLLPNNAGVQFHKELPVFILPTALDEAFFAEKNIIISSFAYPDPSGIKINRAVINALHTAEDLLELTEAILGAQ